ncbi:hypothetical protein ACQB6R_13370 [Propionibacteriaceae bacterium G1746]|uniref:hypothetical protein n=1 Tax=Aestuariimicrobium sp. G57 TaxID=3418485 RepID=UPI003C140D7D
MVQVVQSLFVLVLAVVVIAWVLSPLESLAWWTARGEKQSAKAALEYEAAMEQPLGDERVRRVFVVYYSGIAAFDDDFLARAERPILRRLEQHFPEITVIEELYPYAVENRGLVDDRRSSPFWRWVVKGQKSKRWSPLFTTVLNLRNIYQVLVSADPRYGPVYSAGIAQVAWTRLARNGYIPGLDEVILLGWSGGAQIAAGAAWYLGSAGARVTLVSLGGIFTSDPGLERCQRIIHLTGSKDWQSRQMAPMVFPGRRSWVKRSAWNRARAEGRVTEQVIGPFKHVGRGSYLSATRLADGRTYSEATSDALAEALEQAGLLVRQD